MADRDDDRYFGWRKRALVAEDNEQRYRVAYDALVEAVDRHTSEDGDPWELLPQELDAIEQTRASTDGGSEKTFLMRIKALETAAKAVTDTDARHCGREGVRASVKNLEEVLRG